MPANHKSKQNAPSIHGSSLRSLCFSSAYPAFLAFLSIQARAHP
jgi:hypothetical protein